MAQQVAWAAGKLGVEDKLLGMEGDTAAYSGRLGQARDLSRQAVVSAKRAEEKEVAAGYEADAALREALFGNPAEARQRAAAALGLSNGRDVQFKALALAFTGDAVRAQTLADDLGNRFPEHTVTHFNYLPMIRAQLALSRKILQRLSRSCKPQRRMNWVHRASCIPSMCVVSAIWPHTKAPKPPRNFRTFSITTGSWSAIP